MNELERDQYLAGASESIGEDELRFVLDSVIEFIEELKLSGDDLIHGSQLLRDVEALREKRL